MLEHPLNVRREMADEIVSARRLYFVLLDLKFMVLPFSRGLKAAITAGDLKHRIGFCCM